MKEIIDVNYRYGEIKLWCSSRKQDDVGVVVEAKTDELFFRKFFSKNTSFFSTDGFSNLNDLMIKVNENSHTELIGIIDSDFRRITNENIEHNNVFMTDGHDIEMMMIDSPAWNEILNFHINRNKLEEFEIAKGVKLKEYIIGLSSKIACVRYLNHIKNIGLIFRIFKNGKPDFIDYHKFIKDDDLSIDIEKMLTIIENKSSKQRLFTDKPELKDELNKICQDSFDLSEFCNGHDIMNILAYSFKKSINNKNILSTDLENQFIIAYRYDDFKKSSLYASLGKWENKNSEFNLLLN